VGGVGGAGGKGGFEYDYSAEYGQPGHNGGNGGAGGAGGGGVYARGASIITNLGTILGGAGGAGGAGGDGSAGFGANGATGAQGIGIVLAAGGTVTNGAAGRNTALIAGGVGVSIVGTGTVTNFGTIQGVTGPSVAFASAHDRLIAEAGSSFLGQIAGGGGALELAGGAGTITGLGTAGTLTGAVAATFSGFGAYVIDAGAAWRLVGASALRTGQTLTLNGSLSNAGALSGAGVIAGAGRLANLAGAAIDANGSHRLVLGMTGVLTNAGLVEASGGGALIIAGAIDDSGGGTIAAAGGRVFLEGADVIGGALTTTGGGHILDAAPGAVLDGRAGHAVTLSGALLVMDKASLTLEGAIANKGTITVQGAGDVTELLIGGSFASLSGGGSLILADSTTSRIGAAAASSLVNVDNKITGGGMLGGGGLTLVNDAAGVIDGNGAAGLIIDTGANTVISAGLIEATTSGGTTIKSAIRNSGHLLASHGILTVYGPVSGGGVAGVVAGTVRFLSSFSENFAFLTATPSGVLWLAQSQAYGGTIYNFSKTGSTRLDLRDIAFVNANEASFSGAASGGVLTVTDGTHTAHIHLNGNYLGSNFVAASDGHGGTVVVDPTGAAAAQRFIEASASMAAPPASAQPSHEVWRASASMLTRPGTSSAGCFA
jgi:hypothetical protein